MVPSNCISIYGNTAWVLENDWLFGRPVYESMKRLDRVCDYCNGKGTAWYQSEQIDCPYCYGFGRHTFEFEVEHPDLLKAAHVASDAIVERLYNSLTTLTVSIVPNKVLQVYKSSLACVPYVHLSSNNTMSNDLPIPTQPGQFVAQLKIHKIVNPDE